MGLNPLSPGNKSESLRLPRGSIVAGHRRGAAVAGVLPSPMSRIAGIDGCKGGWVVALREVGSDAIEIRVVEAIHEVLRWRERPGVICIDIPIGLLDAAVAGGRACDQAARALLRQPRGCSVFSPPVRPTLRASSFEEALRLNRASSTHALGISRQSFEILRKIREVDDMMLPSLQDRVFEVHPEVSLWVLPQSSVSGQAITHLRARV